jgi:rubrerythrin
VNEDVIRSLEQSRIAEKEQALFYRALAAIAEEGRQDDLSQRFHDLHADEQHHLSRLTARLIEIGRNPADLSTIRSPSVTLQGWEVSARERERVEVARYEALAHLDLDAHTHALIDEILGVERQHARELGGKWTLA